MDRIFDVNFKKLMQWLLPFKLRREGITALLFAMVSQIEWIHSGFERNRSHNLYRLKITPQICYLEKFLNDRYDIQLRRIRIVDNTVYAKPVYLYIAAENKPLYLYTRAENKPVYLYTKGEVAEAAGDFKVVIPAGVSYNENQLRGEIDSYKLAGMKYEIVVSG